MQLLSGFRHGGFKSRRQAWRDGVSLGEFLATIHLTEHHGKTTHRMTLLFPSKQARDGAIASGRAHGLAAGYDRLEPIPTAKLRTHHGSKEQTRMMKHHPRTTTQVHSL
jgi:hypothetical protein